MFCLLLSSSCADNIFAHLLFYKWKLYEVSIHSYSWNQSYCPWYDLHLEELPSTTWKLTALKFFYWLGFLGRLSEFPASMCMHMCTISMYDSSGKGIFLYDNQIYPLWHSFLGFSYLVPFFIMEVSFLENLSCTSFLWRSRIYRKLQV